MAVAVLEMTDRTVISDSDIDSTAEYDVAGGPCILHAVHLSNDNATAAYLKLYDNVAPVVGTTAPDEIILVEGSGGLNAGKFSLEINPPDGLEFENGLSLACVEDAGTAGTTTTTGTVTVGMEIERSD